MPVRQAGAAAGRPRSRPPSAYCPPVRTDHPTGEPAPDPPGLTACALCAGETLGHRDPLPGGQAERLRRLADDGVARLTLVDCLDECERGDVVVARPTAGCRRSGATPVWFERLAGDDATAELESWLRAGGPGRAPLPPALEPHALERQPDATSTDPA